MIFGLWGLHVVEWRISINPNASTFGALSRPISSKPFTMRSTTNSWRASLYTITPPLAALVSKHYRHGTISREQPNRAMVGAGAERLLHVQEQNGNNVCGLLPEMVLPRGSKTKKIQFFDKISTCKGTDCSLLTYLCTRFQKQPNQ